MALRRGFKAEANWYAREMRRELGLAPVSPLCPWKLAEHLGFPVFPLSEYAAIAPDAVRYLRSKNGQKDFSAITLFDGHFRWIIHNDAHDPKRQAANIAHELAHGLLLHRPAPLFTSAGVRHYNAEQEEEASWLGPALLISDEAALHIVERKMAIEVASDRYGASIQVIQMRMNVSGATRRVGRRVALDLIH